jgi:CheY-like chemotaxis protein
MMSERVLVVDDEPAFGAVVRRVAERLGLTVEVTTGARDFKAMYASLQPTIIVMDVVMPDEDGIQLIEWLKTQHCTARLVIVSGFHPSYAQMAEILGGIGGFMPVTRLAKPVSLADLEAALMPPPDDAG